MAWAFRVRKNRTSDSARLPARSLEGPIVLRVDSRSTGSAELHVRQLPRRGPKGAERCHSLPQSRTPNIPTFKHARPCDRDECPPNNYPRPTPADDSQVLGETW